VTELRQDWLTGRTVLFAEHRAERPNEFLALAGATSSSIAAASAGPCPFCPDHEADTPPAVFTCSDDNGRWRVRVVPNKFPAVAVDEPLAIGAHEVIIESARHLDRMASLSVAELADVLIAYCERLAHWRSTGNFRYGLVFKNLSAAAGASLAHIHSQLIALPELPTPVAGELARAQQALFEEGDCPYCRLIESERELGERVVLERDGLIAFCPYVSLQPGEVWIMPTAHEPWFEQRQPPDGANPAALAEIMRALLVRIEAILPRPAYNLLVRTSPWQEDAEACGHWRIEILPRVNPLAGFELATQMYINPICPTRAAQQLRSS
jgi:UDPglucose--hexose-1-phosphate uridylyltransferase